MKQYTKAIIRKSRLNVDGETHVLIYYSKEQTKYFPTNVWIAPKCWNKNKQYVKDNCNSNDADRLNEIIYKLKNELNDLIEEFRREHLKTPTGNELEKLYRHSQIQEIKTNSYNLVGDFDSWINTQKFRKAEGTIAIYQQTLNYLTSFTGYEIKPFEIRYEKYQFRSLEDVDRKFLEKFRDWLGKRKSRSTKENLSNSTINKQIKILQRFLRAKSNDGERISSDAFNVELDIRKNPKVFLNDKEIEAIKSLDIQGINQDNITAIRKKTLEFARDLFNINLFYGLRVGDLFNLRISNVHLSDENEEQNYISIVTEKTHQAIELPIIHKEIKEIFNKYLELAGEDGYLFPKLSLHSYNLSLKLLAKYAGITQEILVPVYSNSKRINQYIPKWKKISSHSIRKASINKNILELGRDYAKIISTHKSESGFAPYVELTDQEKNMRLIREKVKDLQKNANESKNKN